MAGGMTNDSIHGMEQNMAWDLLRQDIIRDITSYEYIYDTHYYITYRMTWLMTLDKR